MQQTSPYRHSFLFRHFGHCDRCMKKALFASICGWGAYVLTLSAAGSSPVIWSVGLIAVALSLLWLAHLIAYAFKVTWSSRANPVDRSGRRRVLALMARAAGIGVLASVPAMLLPSAAAAFCGQCTKDADCGVGWSCKNTAPVNSGTVCNECVQD